jgi:hypothetical protein
VSKAVAIEVLCPSCGGTGVDCVAGSSFLTEEMVGYSVTCLQCSKSCLVPLNAFSLQGEVIAREKPLASVPNSKLEKKGRTKKERKSNAGRKAKSGTVRQPLQLSLDIRTINTFLIAWSKLGHEMHEED